MQSSSELLLSYSLRILFITQRIWISLRTNNIESSTTWIIWKKRCSQARACKRHLRWMEVSVWFDFNLTWFSFDFCDSQLQMLRSGHYSVILFGIFLLLAQRVAWSFAQPLSTFVKGPTFRLIRKRDKQNAWTWNCYLVMSKMNN